MQQSLSYVLVTPYTVAKSRTGGVLSRLLSRISLELVGAQMIAMDQEVVNAYAQIINAREKEDERKINDLLHTYIEDNLGPSFGSAHRSLLLLFRGENPTEELAQVVGTFQCIVTSVETVTGESIRDTYADLIYQDEQQTQVRYFEPAVITAQSQEEADTTLALFAKWLDGKSNIITNRPPEYYQDVERTLVIIKPDNWKYASSRPGMIMDMFSRSGLRIVAIKVLKMSVTQALHFYGPTKDGLKARLAPIYGMQARELLESEFNVHLPPQLEDTLTESFGDMYSEEQFERIVEFMAGIKPSDLEESKWDDPGLVKSMVLVYEGKDAVQKIRTILGATDPNKAAAGTIRREFGSNIRVNAAHASDSTESADREMGVLAIEENATRRVLVDYLSTKGVSLP
ncbi:MAG: nucleoside-diphosphate kinase [Spirochaetales bacterium]|jgi:nucleoside diphosphate kinase|nr:nucleoside-diphosphate kinase [Spirochaetales bacterium]